MYYSINYRLAGNLSLLSSNRPRFKEYEKDASFRSSGVAPPILNQTSLHPEERATNIHRTAGTVTSRAGFGAVEKQTRSFAHFLHSASRKVDTPF